MTTIKFDLPKPDSFEKATKSNCIMVTGHTFSKITDNYHKMEIQKEHPKMIAPLWKCIFCGRITEAS